MKILQVYDTVLSSIVKAYGEVMKRIGDPVDKNTLYGPLHNQTAVDKYKETVAQAVKAGGKIEFGGKVRSVTVLYHSPETAHEGSRAKKVNRPCWKIEVASQQCVASCGT